MIGALFILSLLLCVPLFSFDIVEAEGKEAIAEILAVQKSLLLALDVKEMPEFAKTGFLTVAMTPENVQRCEKRILAYEEGRVVGYLLLETVEGYQEWAKGKKFDGDLGPLSNIYTIDQIGVLTAFARRGAGTALVDYAKKLSPGGLLTDSLSEPYPNWAAIAFFKRQGFSLLGTLEVPASEVRGAHKISVWLWP